MLPVVVGADVVEAEGLEGSVGGRRVGGAMLVGMGGFGSSRVSSGERRRSCVASAGTLEGSDEGSWAVLCDGSGTGSLADGAGSGIVGSIGGGRVGGGVTRCERGCWSPNVHVPRNALATPFQVAHTRTEAM